MVLFHPSGVLTAVLSVSVHQSSRHFQSMLYERQKLPAWQERENILDLLESHQVLVVSGMTG